MIGKRELVLLAALVAVVSAGAFEVFHEQYKSSGQYLGRVAANAAAASRTMTIDTRRVSKINLAVGVFSRNACTITVTPSVMPYYDGASWAQLQSAAVSSGTATLSALSYSKTLTSSGSFALELPALPWARMKFVIATADGSSLDYLWAYAVGGAGE